MSVTARTPLTGASAMRERPWALILHGGARTIAPDEAAAHRTGCLAAVEAGEAVLSSHGDALDAVEAVVRVLEADETFNAGQGAALNAEGVAELDAAVMTGADLAVGAVAALQGVRHPVSVARRLLAERETLLAGQGARRFALRQGLADRDVTAAEASRRRPPGDTVGCVVLDQLGRMAVGLSTGGLAGKAPGRLGDTPLPGCGFYVDDLVGGVALSGDGEAIARTMLAARIMLGMADQSPQSAARSALAQLERVGGEAGAIVLDRTGRFGCAHTSEHFAVGFASHRAAPRAALHQSELKDLIHD